MVDNNFAQLCPAIIFAATPPYDGTLSRYYSLPADLAYLLPENVSLEDGAMVRSINVRKSPSSPVIVKDGTSFSGSSLCVNSGCFPDQPEHRSIWMWAHWTPVHGCGESTGSLPYHCCGHQP